MRVPLSWLLEYAGPARRAGEPGDRVRSPPADRGRPRGRDGRAAPGTTSAAWSSAEVLEIEELTGFKKPIRYCQVDVPGERPGAAQASSAARPTSPSVDLVPLALPGAVLPGGFEIGARKAYGQDVRGHDLLGRRARPRRRPLRHPGAARRRAAGPGLRRCGRAARRGARHRRSPRTAATRCRSAAWPGTWRMASTPRTPTRPARACPRTWPASPARCSRPASTTPPRATGSCCARSAASTRPRPTPLAMRVRLARCGMRSISLAVDVTNYLMIELGQPLHAFDRSDARPGRSWSAAPGRGSSWRPSTTSSAPWTRTTSSSPTSPGRSRWPARWAGWPPRSTPDSADLVIEAAHFSMAGIARMSRRHRLFSEASAPVRAGRGPRAAAARLGPGGVAADRARRRHAWCPAARTRRWTWRR